MRHLKVPGRAGTIQIHWLAPLSIYAAGLVQNYNFDKSKLSLCGENSTRLNFATVPSRIHKNRLHCGCNPCLSNRTVDEASKDASVAIRAVQEDGTAVHCRMFYSSFNLKFTYSTGQQDINIKVRDSEKLSPITQDILQGIVNSQKYFRFGDGMGQEAEEPLSGSCSFDPLVFQTWSYQSVIQAFMDIIAGLVNLPFEKSFEASTRIRKISFVNTIRLNLLHPRSDNCLDGLIGSDTLHKVSSLQEALESAGVPIGGRKQRSRPAHIRHLHLNQHPHFRHWPIFHISQRCCIH